MSGHHLVLGFCIRYLRLRQELVRVCELLSAYAHIHHDIGDCADPFPLDALPRVGGFR